MLLKAEKRVASRDSFITKNAIIYILRFNAIQTFVITDPLIFKAKGVDHK